MAEPMVTRRQLIKGSTLGAAALLAAAVLLMVNYLGARHYQRFDWTSSKLYSLSEKTLNLLHGLDEDIEFVVFINPEHNLYHPVKELLERYSAASPAISVREIDPVRDPLEAQKLLERYGIQHDDVVVVASAVDRRVISVDELAEWDYSGMESGLPAQMTGFRGEASFSAAIVELTHSKKPKVVLTTGHGELSLDDSSEGGLSSLNQLLGKDNFELETWASLTSPQVPRDTDLVIVAGPQLPFQAPELAALGSYLSGGGRVLLLLDPRFEETGPKSNRMLEQGFTEWLAGYGVRLGQNVVLDPDNTVPFLGQETFVANDYEDHPITHGLRETRQPVLFALARSVGRGEAVPGLEVTELVHTSASGWGERSLGGVPEKGSDDLAGPVSLGVVVTSTEAGKAKPGDDSATGDESATSSDASSAESTGGDPAADRKDGSGSGMRLVVFGDSDFASNRLLAELRNAVLVNNVLNWMVAREDLLGIPPKTPEHVRLNLAPSQMSSLYWLILLVLPGLSLAAGALVRYKRRR